MQRLYGDSGRRVLIEEKGYLTRHATIAAQPDRDRAAGADAVPPLLAENIAYGRPSAGPRAIEQAARLTLPPSKS
ncbi:hypothetical protein MA20_44200 [Bradyrhizobium japonicum]|uniref:Uncharacterized protein n=1 Tax=Bradyrhizobium japonicum TaxID=375 RepID=A0A0A3XGJ6_BRAJP|nr:hypothetical protein MA20_44200 [Bradyrhizobium japonicum]